MEKAKIKTIMLQKKDHRVTESFERRLEMLLDEIGKTESHLRFIKELNELKRRQHRLFSEAPNFMDWLYEAKEQAIYLSLAKVFEVRRKAKDLKNLPVLIRFLKDHAPLIFYRRYYRVVEGEAHPIVTEKPETLLQALNAIIDENVILIRTIIAYRDKVLTHLTSTMPKSDFDVVRIETLIQKTRDVLLRIKQAYDGKAYPWTPPRQSDFFLMVSSFFGGY